MTCICRYISVVCCFSNCRRLVDWNGSSDTVLISTDLLECISKFVTLRATFFYKKWKTEFCVCGINFRVKSAYVISKGLRDLFEKVDQWQISFCNIIYCRLQVIVKPFFCIRKYKIFFCIHLVIFGCFHDVHSHLRCMYWSWFCLII